MIYGSKFTQFHTRYKVDKMMLLSLLFINIIISLANVFVLMNSDRNVFQDLMLWRQQIIHENNQSNSCERNNNFIGTSVSIQDSQDHEDLLICKSYLMNCLQMRFLKDAKIVEFAYKNGKKIKKELNYFLVQLFQTIFLYLKLITTVSYSREFQP